MKNHRSLTAKLLFFLIVFVFIISGMKTNVYSRDSAPVNSEYDQRNFAGMLGPTVPSSNPPGSWLIDNMSLFASIIFLTAILCIISILFKIISKKKFRKNPVINANATVSKDNNSQYCGNCGIKKPKNAKFCPTCGKPVQNESTYNQIPVKKNKTLAAVNPSTSDVILKAGELIFKCPVCPNAVSVTLQQIDPVIGINVICPECKNISHVPGAYKTKQKTHGMRITAGVPVPIAEFADWYYEHPLIEPLIKNRQSELLYNYGLWAFCKACYHQFPATVLSYFSIARDIGGLVFSARTPESAKDMEALRDGHCSQCEHKNLIVIVTEIPDYVRDVIKRNK